MTMSTRIPSNDLMESARALADRASELDQAVRVEEAERNISVEVQEVFGNAAAASVISSAYIDHLQLAKMDGAWRIVNVLWVPNPEG